MVSALMDSRGTCSSCGRSSRTSGLQCNAWLLHEARSATQLQAGNSPSFSSVLTWVGVMAEGSEAGCMCMERGNVLSVRHVLPCSTLLLLQ